MGSINLHLKTSTYYLMDFKLLSNFLIILAPFTNGTFFVCSSLGLSLWTFIAFCSVQTSTYLSLSFRSSSYTPRGSVILSISTSSFVIGSNISSNGFIASYITAANAPYPGMSSHSCMTVEKDSTPECKLTICFFNASSCSKWNCLKSSNATYITL